MKLFGHFYPVLNDETVEILLVFESRGYKNRYTLFSNSFVSPLLFSFLIYKLLSIIGKKICTMSLLRGGKLFFLEIIQKTP
jgi:hypothetical protein